MFIIISKKTVFFITFLIFPLFAFPYQNLNFKFDKSDWQNKQYEIIYDYKNYNDLESKINYGTKLEYFSELQDFKFNKGKENLFRRAEILVFGSLTFATFGGWFFFSVFNTMIYNEPFGKLRREQFLPLYLGSSVISISVVLSDLFINIKPRIKKVEIY